MLKKKMLRDIKLNKAQYITIFLMLFLGIFIFTGIQSEWYGMRSTSDVYYKETNLADAWVMKDKITDADMEALLKNEKIQEVQRRLYIEAAAVNQNSHLDIMINEADELSKFKLCSGQAYDETKKGIWLDQTYAVEHNYHVGDALEININGQRYLLNIQGLVLHPEFTYASKGSDIIPDHKKYGFAIISPKSLSWNEIPYNQILVKGKGTHLDIEIKNSLEDASLQVLLKKQHPSVNTLENEILQHQAFAKLFPIVFLMIALFTTLTSINKIIRSQRTQIGILTALGFTRKQIKHHYTTGFILIVLLAIILGAISGPLLLPTLLYGVMEEMYVLPDLHAMLPIDNVSILIMCFLLCVILIYFGATYALKEDAASLLRPAVGKTVSLNARKHHRNFYITWNLRDISRNKMRSCITIIGVGGCMMLMVCALALYDSSIKLPDIYRNQNHYETKVKFHEDVSEEVKQIWIQDVNGEMLIEGNVEISTPKNHTAASLLVLPYTDMITLQDEYDKRMHLPQDGVICSRKMAELLDVNKGDQITWRIAGTTHSYTSNIKAINYTPMNQGITISQKYMEKLGLHLKVTSLISGQHIDKHDVTKIGSIEYQDDMIENMNALMEAMYLMAGIMILGAAVLAITVIYNLQALSYYEHLRELATLKVLGFTTKKLKKLLQIQQFLLSLAGMIIGLPLGYAMCWYTFQTVGDAMDYVVAYNPLSIIASICFTLILSMSISWLMLRRLKKIDMVEALKINE